jgi:hypothetical protein
MFLIDLKYWKAGTVQERLAWVGQDRGKVPDSEFFQKILSGNFEDQLIWKLAQQFSVARTFRREIRSEYLTKFRALRIDAKGEDERFIEFVRGVRDLADFVYQKTNRRPLSGSSKLLSFRFPNDGFIYDKNAYSAVTNTGLLAPFCSHLDTWGGAPEDCGVANFLVFAAAHYKFFRPLHNVIHKVLEKSHRNPERAARIVDQVLWIAGEQNAAAREKKLKLASDIKDDEIEIAVAGQLAAERLIEDLGRPG